MWRKQNSGMTLIEVLLVIGLVLALSVVVHRGLSKQRETAIVKTVISLIQTDIKDLIIEKYIALQEDQKKVYVDPGILKRKLVDAVNKETDRWKMNITLDLDINFRFGHFPVIEIKPVGWDALTLKQNEGQLKIDLDKELLSDKDEF